MDRRSFLILSAITAAASALPTVTTASVPKLEMGELARDDSAARPYINLGDNPRDITIGLFKLMNQPGKLFSPVVKDYLSPRLKQLYEQDRMAHPFPALLNMASILDEEAWRSSTMLDMKDSTFKSFAYVQYSYVDVHDAFWTIRLHYKKYEDEWRIENLLRHAPRYYDWNIDGPKDQLAVNYVSTMYR